MDSITCDIRNEQDIMLHDMPVTLTALTSAGLNHLPNKTFKGHTGASGEIYTWSPYGHHDALETIVEQAVPNEGSSDSMWSLCIETKKYFGRENTIWPMVDIVFFLTRRQGWRFHVRVSIAPHYYHVSVIMLPNTFNLDPNTMEDDGDYLSLSESSVEASTPQQDTHYPEQNRRTQEEIGQQIALFDPENRPETRPRNYLTSVQIQILNESYARNPYPGGHEYDRLSKEIGIGKRRIQNWFKEGPHSRLPQDSEMIAVDGQQSQDQGIDPAVLSGHGTSHEQDQAGPIRPTKNGRMRAERQRDINGRFVKRN